MATKKTTKKKAPARPRGRPSAFTTRVANEICERLAEGEPLRQICRDERMPAWQTVYRWKDADEAFSRRIAYAREAGHDAIAHECLEIADETSRDTLVGENGERANTEWISRSKLRVETRLKLLAKWDPKRYGEKLALGGADDLPPIATMTDEQLAAKIAQKMAAINGDEG